MARQPDDIEQHNRVAPDKAMSSLGLIELSVTAFLTGAAVMLIEIEGTRIVGPVFGVSLFVWAALLVITLGSLAVGYLAGGILVDRHPSPRLLNGLVLIAGGTLGLVPPLSRAVLGVSEGLGPRFGPLLAASILFSPSLAALGTVGPVGVRLAMKSLVGVGRGVGLVYAISTSGSLLGTLLTAFALIPAFETNTILVGAATGLALLGAIPLGRRWRQSAMLVPLLPLGASLCMSAPQYPAGVKVLATSQSLYGLVQVIDDSNRHVRFLRSDHSVIGAQWSIDGSAAFGFIHLLEAVRFYTPPPKNMLAIGLGTGSLPRVLGHHGIVADVVEIDDAVVRFAQQYFDFATKGAIHVEDARTFLRRATTPYDVIVHDTFTGGTTPEHLLSAEVIDEVHRLLRPEGVFALNFVGYATGPKAEASLAVARTVRSVFRVVRAFRDGPPDEDADKAGNIVFFASDAPLRFSIPADAAFENDSCEKILRSFQSWEVLNDVPPGPIIVDARNPLGRLQLATAEEHFEAMKKLLPSAVWLP